MPRRQRLWKLNPEPEGDRLVSSTQIYTSELILCSVICGHSATRHNIHMYPYFLFAAIHHPNRPQLSLSDLVAQSAEQILSGGRGFKNSFWGLEGLCDRRVRELCIFVCHTNHSVGCIRERIK